MKKSYMGNEKFEKFPKVPIYCICVQGEGLLAPTHLDYTYINKLLGE